MPHPFYISQSEAMGCTRRQAFWKRMKVKMKKKLYGLLSILLLFCLLAGCGAKSGTENEKEKSESGNALLQESASGDEEESLWAAVSLEGGSGKASLESPAELTASGDAYMARICWSSSNYDYMIVDGETYYPVNSEGNSVFEIPIPSVDCSIEVQADTTAMSKPYLIDYTLHFGAEASGDASADADTDTEGKKEAAAELPGLKKTGSMKLDYAKEFTVDYYENDLALITIAGNQSFLLLPEGAQAPENLPEGITLLQQPLDKIYLVSSAAMDMFASCGGMDSLAFCALDKKSWYIEEAKAAMDKGSLQYAGKYSAPDYELLYGGGCDLAIENTMVLHSPEVVEELESLDIPVMIEHSSYETRPQGRMEWIKLYGLLSGHLEEAESAYEKQSAALEALEGQEKSGKSVAFFYMTSNGSISVRNASDYIPKLIEEAGGSYAFPEIGKDSQNATSTIQIEEFYAAVKDTDYLIYNSSIVGELSDLDDFLALSPLFQDLKAVKENHVYCTNQNLYQSSMEMGDFASDLNRMLNGVDGDLQYIYKLQ